MHNSVVAPPGVRHTASPYGMLPPQQFAHRRELEAAQDLSWRRRSPLDAYRADGHHVDARDYGGGAPWEAAWKSRTGDVGGGGDGGGRVMLSPPPAHSHHAHHARPHTDKLYQLANVATEQQRVDKDHRVYHNDRSQVTPPALQSSASPYAATPPMMGQQQQQQRSRTTIGQPPPLINIKESIEPKVMHQKGMPGIQTHPSSGSITHGTPVNQPPPPGGGMRGGSISMGTPHYDSQPRQATPPQSQGAGRPVPFGYDPMMGRNVAVPHDAGVAMRMPMVVDAASAAAAAAMNRGVPMMMYPGAMERMYQQPGFYPGMQFMPRPPPGVAAVPGGAAQFADYNSSSRATLMGDFLTAQQMHHQQEAAQRRDKDRQLSPRGRDMPPKSPYESQPQVSLPYTTVSTPQGLMAIPHQVTQGNITPSYAQPHENSTPMAWPMVNRHGPPPPQLSPGGKPPGSRPREAYSPAGMPPGPRPREVYLPPRQNVIQQHVKPHGSVIMEPRMSPLAPSPRIDSHYMVPDSTSPRHSTASSFETLMNVASRYVPQQTLCDCIQIHHIVPVSFR